MATWPSGITGSWHYTGDPSHSNRDAVRFEVGDTDPDDPLVSDEEVDYALSEENSKVAAAAARVCEHLAARAARLVDVTADDGLAKRLTQRVSNWQSLAKELRTKASRTGVPYAGGISVDDKNTRTSDTDRPTSSVRRGMFDYT